MRFKPLVNAAIIWLELMPHWLGTSSVHPHMPVFTHAHILVEDVPLAYALVRFINSEFASFLLRAVCPSVGPEEDIGVSASNDGDVSEELGSRCLCLLLVLLFYPTPKSRIEAYLHAQQRYMRKRNRDPISPAQERLLRTHVVQLINVLQQERHCISHAYGKLATESLDGLFKRKICGEGKGTRQFLEVRIRCIKKDCRSESLRLLVGDKSPSVFFFMRAGKPIFHSIRIAV